MLLSLLKRKAIYGRQHKRYDQYGDTHVINAFERCVFDFDDENLKEHLR